jgi:diguanylate cyclase (GGDEF)-like protein
MNISRGSRRTIGVLAGWQMYDGPALDPAIMPLLQGIRAAAQARDVNLLVAAGLSRGTDRQRVTAAWPIQNDHTDFVPVGETNTDGLIILSPVVAQECKKDIHRLLARGFPVVFLGLGEGTPAVAADNPGGIRSMLDHLVSHGHRRIAFLAGFPHGNSDSQERLDTYRECVRSMPLEDDPRLVDYGSHSVEGGYLAIRRILQSGVTFSAVLASNDASAAGAMRGLLDIGLRIPQDVAVAGFCDQGDFLAAGPSLTSVHYPMYESGSTAVHLLLRRVEEGPDSLAEITRMGTWLVKRQSCGCAAVPTGRVVRMGARRSAEDLVQVMLDALLAEMPSAQEQDARADCERLIQSFARSLEDGDLAPFQVAVTGIVQRVDSQNEDAHAWQLAISVLRENWQEETSTGAQAASDRLSAEDLLHQARTLLGDSARRRHARLQMQWTHRMEAMGWLISRLMVATRDDQILEGLAEGLPRVGVSSAHMAFLKPSGEDKVAGSVIRFARTNRPPLLFPSREFPPDGLYPKEKPYHAILLPVVASEGQLGYMAFTSQELDLLATIARQVAAMLVGVRLEERLQRLILRDPITGFYNQRFFNLILREEVERCRQNGHVLSVILADVDHFSRYNDTFGYAAGDEALREMGRCMLQGARRGLDVVTRFGADQFAVILPDTGSEGAKRVAEEIRRQAAGSERMRSALTVSLGVATTRGEGACAATLVRRAGQARLLAKAAGRNLVLCL